MFGKYYGVLDVLNILHGYVSDNKENVDLDYLYSEVEKTTIHEKFKKSILMLLKEQADNYNYDELIAGIINEADLYFEYAD